FDITLAGNLRDKRASLDMTIKNPQIQDARVTGTISLAQLALDLKVAGGVQLSLANPMLAASGNRLAGKAQINAAVTGSASVPNLRGTIRLADARFDDVVNGVTISKINGDIVGDGRALVLQNIKGQTVNGGTVTLTGKVTVDPAAGIPADIGIAFDKATLVSSETARLVADGRLQASGALMTRPKISGRVQVRRLDINLPDKLSGAAKPIEVRHIGAAPGKKSGKAKAEAAKANAAKAESPFIADLDLTLSAPNGIFVRGMGMEAELGGDLSVQGTSAAPRSLGGFEFKRGRFDGFGKRLDFSKGLISFNGSLDPELDFVAQTESEGIIAKVLISGPASAPKIGFASTPTLPQDEVIARLLFDKSSSELTMGQAAQLAQTIAQFSGSGPGMLDKMRQSLGVDSLDVGTDNGGEVGMGKRINDRVYLGVKQGAQPNSSKVTIDVDITKNIRAQGATGADGSTEVGIGAEWDY
ncbi:MAG: translocation/assembly module TamB domain-containing protein, partial [Pseudomonadota bacterium]